MKKSIILISLIIMMIISLVVPNLTYAIEIDGLGNLDDYKSESAEMGTLKTKAEDVLSLIKVVGVIVSVVALMGIGIKYMLGSLEEKAQYKQTLKPYLIGAFLVFTVSLLPEIIYNIMKNLE